MLRSVVQEQGGVRVVLLDSMSQVIDEDRGQIVVAASNGGIAAGAEGIRADCRCVVLNDAGFGYADAGVAGLRALDEALIPGVAVSHDSAEISNGMDMWENGVISFVNASAAANGFAVGEPMRGAVLRFLAAQASI